MSNKISKAYLHAKNYGIGSMIRTSLLHIISSPQVNQSDIFKYDELIAPQFGANEETLGLNKKTINWFIPPVGKGSGGHLNIFRFIRNLEKLGYQNRIVIVNEPQPKSAEVAKKNIEKWFFPIKAEVFINDGSKIPPAFFAMATEWRTAYFVKRYMGCVQKCYFVQDFEPYFYPTGTDYIFAENTYRFGFYGFTAGSWLAAKLKQDYGMSTTSLGFSYDRELYTLDRSILNVDKKASSQKVFFYARPPTSRRGFEMGMLVLREVKKRLPGISIILAGWDMVGYKIPFDYDNAGLVKLDHLAELYKQCDVALVLSFSNVSLLPLELMACGVPVVSNKAPYTEWLLNEEVSVLAEPDVESLTQAILSVLNDASLSSRLKINGLNFCNDTSWELEAEKLAKGLDQIAAQTPDAFTPNH